jgi:thiol-disulfide isomerase/thioredoxin
MMRKYIFLFCLLATGKFLFAQQKFILKGKVKGFTSGFIYLNYDKADGKVGHDSCIIKPDGVFLFTGNIAEPAFSYLYYSKTGNADNQNAANFFLEPILMTVQLEKDKFSEAILTGSKTQQLYHQLEIKKKPVYAKLHVISAEYRKEKDEYQASLIREKMIPYIRQLDTLDYKFFAAHPASYVTGYMLRFHVADFPWEGLDAYYSKLGDDVQRSIYGRYIKQEIEKLKAGSPGSVANDFSKTDINGTMVSLSEFKGKSYVLVDFWASWCVPCRKGNPHMRQIYAQYKDRGLEIIGVSDDDGQEEKWRKAVKQDSLPWRNVLRGRDWQNKQTESENENDLHKKFGIHDLPTKILVDKNGVIVGRYNENDEELDTKLKEIFSH